MKKLLFILIAITSLSAKGFAQNTDTKRENIESLRVAYLTRQVGLNEEEAKKFWPVYNSYREEIQRLKNERRTNALPDNVNYEALSDQETEKMVDNIIVYRQKELDVEKKYHEKFKQILPIKKVAKLYKAENGFKRELLKKVKEEQK
jgi:hypothetical protein